MGSILWPSEWHDSAEQNEMVISSLILGKQTHLVDVFCIPCHFHVQYL